MLVFINRKAYYYGSNCAIHISIILIICQLSVIMTSLQAITVTYLLVFAVRFSVSANELENHLPKLLAPYVIPSNGVDKCPSDEDRQAARQLLHSVSNQVLQNYSINPNCGPGLWRQVFYLNASDEDQSCPGDWNNQTVSRQSIRVCGGSGRSCQSAFSDDINIAYNKVCGRVIGIGRGSLDAFSRFILNQTTIEDNYLDGVSVTHGAPGCRTHIWSFGAGHPAGVYSNEARCPCDNSNRTIAPLPPSEVGENYFCATTHRRDRLWSGSDCNTASSCCSFHHPPYFSVQLPTPTTDQIELRICSDQELGNERALVLFAEIYVH